MTTSKPLRSAELRAFFTVKGHAVSAKNQRLQMMDFVRSSKGDERKMLGRFLELNPQVVTELAEAGGFAGIRGERRRRMMVMA